MRLKSLWNCRKGSGAAGIVLSVEASTHAQVQKMNIWYVTQNKPNINPKRGYATLSNVTSDTA